MGKMFIGTFLASTVLWGRIKRISKLVVFFILF